MSNSFQTIFDRLLACFSYITMGAIGIIWYILNVLFIKKQMSGFLMCNLIQSFMISVLYAAITFAYGTFMPILIHIPFIGKLFLSIHLIFVATPIFYTLSLVNAFLVVLMFYLAIFSLFGQLPFIPYITNLVKQMCK